MPPAEKPGQAYVMNDPLNNKSGEKEVVTAKSPCYCVQSTTKPADDEGCMNVIRESDEIDLEIKRIQQTYHNRFMEIVSPSKLYDILNAEKRFFRRMMRNWGRGNTQHGHRPQGQR